MSPVIARILSLMSEKNVTAIKLTSDLGMSHTAITDWKKGRGTPKAKTLADIAKYFGVSIDYLITGLESKNFAIPYATPLDKALIYRFHKLPIEVQEEIIRYVDFKIADMVCNQNKKLG